MRSSTSATCRTTKQICEALEAGELDRAADLLLAYLDRSEDNLAEVHGEAGTA